MQGWSVTAMSALGQKPHMQCKKAATALLQAPSDNGLSATNCGFLTTPNLTTLKHLPRFKNSSFRTDACHIISKGIGLITESAPDLDHTERKSQVQDNGKQSEGVLFPEGHQFAG
jgi:hypothetical protein